MDADVSPALGRFTLVKFLPDHLRSVKKLHYRKIISKLSPFVEFSLLGKNDVRKSFAFVLLST